MDLNEKRIGSTIPSEGLLRKQADGLTTYDELKALCEMEDWTFWLERRLGSDDYNMQIVCLVGVGC